jgi:hypothetical protein
VKRGETERSGGRGGRAGDLRRLPWTGRVELRTGGNGGAAGRAEAACRALLLYFWKAKDGGWKEERFGFELAPL